ncbi:putative chromatin regulator PHD family [Helianthus anomalus]
MEFKGIQAEEIIQHEHTLILEDLQLMYQNYQEDDDDIDDQDLINMQKFECTQSSSCSYSLHKSCQELSTTLHFPRHPIHTLHLKKVSISLRCHSCFTKHLDGICYHCSTCDYQIDLRCAKSAEQTMIHHPGHPHPLTSITLDPIISKCYSCGKKHEGVFYHCSTCFNFSIHVDCVALPFKLSSKHHVHKLTLSYSFTVMPSHSICRICEMNISPLFWLYKCSKCRYYIHLDCATSRGEPFMSIFSHGIGSSYTNVEAVDYPNFLHYPLPDESHNILQHHFRREDYRHFDQIIFDKGLYTHSRHNHPLQLINAPDTSILGTLHNPMMRIKLLCNGCLSPITTTPFYVCNKGCHFHLHEWCTRLPSELEKHPGHPQHTLVLFHSYTIDDYKGLECEICGLCCNGFRYHCTECKYRVDVKCGLIMPDRIIHEAHPYHLLSRVDVSSIQDILCNACGFEFTRGQFAFRCNSCDFFCLHIGCALHLPRRIKNKCDRHPLELSYFPIEDYKSDYFCEVCEEELIPERWFYHCKECGQSVHSACASLILKSEQDVNKSSPEVPEGVFKFLNMKFGVFTNLSSHPHPVSCHVGIEGDGCCKFCSWGLQSELIFKCLECNFAIHVRCPSGSRLVDINITRYRPDIEVEDDAAVTFYPGKVIMRPVT